jgi:hypothetical protein
MDCAARSSLRPCTTGHKSQFPDRMAPDEQIVALILNFLHMFSGCPPQVILGFDWRFRLFSPL